MRCEVAATLAAAALLLVACPAEEEPEAPETPALEETPESPEPTPDEDPDDAEDEPDVPELSEPPALDVDEVVSGLAEPTDLISMPDDGRLLVTERAGTARIVDGSEVVEGPFLDIQGRVISDGLEQGLLSIAFHPDDPRRLFAHYSGEDGQTVLAEYEVADGERADPDSEQVLLTAGQPARNHNGGRIAFGPDGMLYLALGDGGGSGDQFGHGQDPTTRLGAMVRLDVSEPGQVRAPRDNPGVAGGGEMAPEVWAYGLRNPYRFAFDHNEDLLYIADVGQNEWEWVNVVPADEGGLNHGWPITEGSNCFDPPSDCPDDDLVQPALEYPSEGADCAIIGGFVYRGEAVDGLAGHYLYSDYCGGWLRSFAYEPDSGEVTFETDHIETGRLGQVYSIGEDTEGEVYVLAGDGTIYRVVAAE